MDGSGYGFQQGEGVYVCVRSSEIALMGVYRHHEDVINVWGNKHVFVLISEEYQPFY